jgi:outer membrane protein assembly factor BamB
MSKRTLLALGAVLAMSCGGGGNELRCSLDEQTTLAGSDWPSFRRDSANTARSDTVVGAGQPQVRCLFPRTQAGTSCIDPALATSPVDTSAVVGTDRLVFATRDGELHFLSFDGTPLVLPNMITLASGAKTPLLGENGDFFVSSGDGGVRRFDMAGELQATGALAGFISVAPVMDSEGVIYVGTVGGSLAAVCPNGGLRFNLAVAPTRAGAAVTTDPLDERGRALILSGSDSGRVQAVSRNGNFRWSFAASSQILAPIVIDETRNAFFVIDSDGRIYSGNLMDGTGISSFRTARCSLSSEMRCDTDRDCPAGEDCLGESITAAAALGESRLYVATEGNGRAGGASPGRLYALDLDTDGAVAPQSAWEFALPAPGVIRSSPAVAQSCDGDLIVFGADLDDCESESGGACGSVFAVDETGLRWSVQLEGRIGSLSPSIRATASSGVVYIGTDAGLYEIAPALVCPANDAAF